MLKFECLPLEKIHITQPWGAKSPRYKSGYHQGIDFRAAFGTPVRIVADGEVTRVEQNYCVVVRTIQGKEAYYHVYYHLSQRFKNLGDEVKAGDVAGLSGGRPDDGISDGKGGADITNLIPNDGIPDPGLTNGAHLHCELRVGFDKLANSVDFRSEIDRLLAEQKQETPSWASNALKWAKDKNLIDKPESSPFSPTQTAWLAEVLRKFYNLYKPL